MAAYILVYNNKGPNKKEPDNAKYSGFINNRGALIFLDLVAWLTLEIKYQPISYFRRTFINKIQNQQN